VRESVRFRQEQTYPERSGGRLPLVEKGARGTGAAALVPASVHRRPEREQRSGTKINFRFADDFSKIQRIDFTQKLYKVVCTPDSTPDSEQA
jgi:hypothetical protein